MSFHAQKFAVSLCSQNNTAAESSDLISSVLMWTGIHRSAMAHNSSARQVER